MQQKIFITGINRGLGKELFNLFSTKNYFVYGVLRNKSELVKFKRKFPENSKIILADLSSDESIKLIQESVRDNPIDLLINNAGIAGNSHLIQNIDSAEIMNLFNIHCLGVFRTTKALTYNLVNANQPIILNLNSRLGSISRQSNGNYENLTVSYSYRIAKASQNMLTNCIRSEFKHRIKVISLHPGQMKTDIASIDANITPIDVAIRILEFYERNKLEEENGIVELDKELIEW